MSSRALKTTRDTARKLLGSWRSDRLKTLEFWGFAKAASAKTKRMFRGRDFFGHLEWHVSAKRIRVSHAGTSRSKPYTVLWKDDFHVIIKIGGKREVSVRDIHFDGDSHFYMLAGRANCEFFRRVRSNKSLERTRDR